MHITEGKLVYPGDKLGTHEEWMPGEGTYEDDGVIYSKILGKVKYDEDKLEAQVEAINPVSSISIGDVVYGTIRDKRSAMATMTINVIEGRSRSVRIDLEGTIHISKISDDYVDSVDAVFLKGDIVRAKIMQIEPSVQLSTMGKNFGVVRGYCFNCRRPMERKGNLLYCDSCERRETRKLSNFYGKIKMKAK